GLRERVSSPLAFSFAASWIVYNFNFVLVLFSEMDVLEKLSYFSNVHFFGWKGVAYGLFWPLFTSVAFILIYPYPSRWVFGYWVIQKRKIDEIKSKAEGLSPIVKERWL